MQIDEPGTDVIIHEDIVAKFPEYSEFAILKQAYKERCTEIYLLNEALSQFHVKYLEIVDLLGFDELPPHENILEAIDGLLQDKEDADKSS